MRHRRRIDYGLQRFLLNHVSVQAMEAKGLSASYGLMAPILVTFGLGIFVSHALLGIFDSNAMQLRNAFAFSAIRLSADLNISLLHFIFFLLGIVVLIALHLYLTRTHTGRRATGSGCEAEFRLPCRIHFSSRWMMPMIKPNRPNWSSR